MFSNKNRFPLYGYIAHVNDEYSTFTVFSGVNKIEKIQIMYGNDTFLECDNSGAN